MAKAHTGHLTGSDAVTSAVFRQFGVTRVDGLDELLDTAAMFARTKPPARADGAVNGIVDGVCIYAISGGTGAHMADMAAAAGLRLPRAHRRDAAGSCTSGSPTTCACRTRSTTAAPRRPTGAAARSSTPSSPTPTSTCSSARSPARCRRWATAWPRTWSTWPTPPTSRSSSSGARRSATRRPTGTSCSRATCPCSARSPTASPPAKAYFDYHAFRARYRLAVRPAGAPAAPRRRSGARAPAAGARAVGARVEAGAGRLRHPHHRDVLVASEQARRCGRPRPSASRSS